MVLISFVLAAREMLSYTKNSLCSAISVLSLGFTPQKKNEWCEAIVLLAGFTSQAVRFSLMKYHVQKGIGFGYTGRYLLPARDRAMQNRWSKLSKAMMKGEYPYVFSHYFDHGTYTVGCVTEFIARRKVSLINDKDKTKRRKFRRRLDKWNGPLGNEIRKREEESKRLLILEKEERLAKNMDSTVLGSMHGFWYGSVGILKYEVGSVKWLPRPAQIFTYSRYFSSPTHPLDRLRVVLQVKANLSSNLLVVKNIWNGGLLAFFRGNVENVDRFTAESTIKFYTNKMIKKLCQCLGSE